MLLYERETIIRFSLDPNEPLVVDTHVKGLATSLKRHKAHLIRVEMERGKEISWTFEMPREWFRAPRPPRKSERKPSPETLAKMQAGRQKKDTVGGQGA